MISNKLLNDKYSNYRCCVVQECKNTSISTPDKLWIAVPRGIKRRQSWLKLAGRDPITFSKHSTLYICDDHFHLEKDMENYMELKVMGSVKRIRMKPDCVPTKFECQRVKKPQTKKKLVEISTPTSTKEKQVYPIEISTPSFSEDPLNLNVHDILEIKEETTPFHCRLCAEQETEHIAQIDIDSFRENFDLYCERFKLHLDLTNDLPKRVCEICYNMLQSAYRFIFKIETSQDVLKEIYMHTDVTDAKMECVSDTESENENRVGQKEHELLLKQVEQQQILLQQMQELLYKQHRILSSAKVHSWTDYPWCCDRCEEYFLDIDSLRSHSLSEHGLCNSFRCIDCVTFVGSFNKFVEHVRRHQSSLRQFCEYCNANFLYDHLCVAHTTEHRNQHICIQCGALFTDKSSLEQHRSSQDIELKCVLEETNVTSGSKDQELNCINGQVSNDQNNTSGTKDQSVIGQECTVDIKVLDSNIKNDHDYTIENKKRKLELSNVDSWQSYTWTCSMCHKNVSDVESLRKHSIDVHKVCFIVKCADCDKVYSDFKSFVNHVVLHRPHLLNYCQYCNVFFAAPTDLRTHIQNHLLCHHICDTCGHLFKSNSALNKHKQIVLYSYI